MTPRQVEPKLLAWGSDIEPGTIEQASRTARLPFVAGHVALMPDAHFGLGATVGSVIPTKGAIIPAAVGCDIGCGMIATETTLSASALPDSLDALMPLIEERVPAGVGKGHTAKHRDGNAERWFDAWRPRTELTHKQTETTFAQFGTLGSGNHFLEVCLDEHDIVWVVLHSGSRGIGNQLAQTHIKLAQKLADQWFIPLEDPDLAYLVQGTPEFGHYIADMLWAQQYALANREQMMDRALASLSEIVGGSEIEGRKINCHHNFTEMERHHGRNVWLTRKGAIRAREGDWGVIPGSMGTRSYIVRGLGNPASFDSCSHGAGRRMSRSRARKELTAGNLADRMEGRVWNADRAEALVDEHPDAYKDIDQVMEDQRDLVEIDRTLTQIFNYKG